MKTAARTGKPDAVTASRPSVTVRKTARLFTNGASQAVRLPKEFRMPGTEVRIWKEGDRVMMEPLQGRSESLADIVERFYALVPEGLQIVRNQPPMQERDWSGVFETHPSTYSATAAKPARKTRSKS